MTDTSSPLPSGASIAPRSRPPTRAAIWRCSASTRRGGIGQLHAIRLGDAASLRKGQIIVTLGNPYAIARDGQASAGWGIVSNLAARARSCARKPNRAAKPLLERYRRLDSDRLAAAPWNQRRAALESKRRDGRSVHIDRGRIGLRVAGRLRDSSRCHVSPRFRDPRSRDAKQNMVFLAFGPGNLTPAEIGAG